MSKYETAYYRVLERHQNIELREYQEMLIAEVSTNGDRRHSLTDGFKQIASYIFGSNKQNQKVSMTTPVMHQHLQGDVWRTQFMMPNRYQLETLPTPNTDQIHIKTLPQQKVMVIRFNGRNTDANLAKHLHLLKQFIQKQKLSVQGEPIYAFYNPPWILPWFRRNEILIKI